MAEKENLQLMQQMIAAINARDLDRYCQGIDDSYEGQSEMIPDGVSGPDGARRAVNMILTAFPDLRIEVEQVFASGDYVIVRARLSGTQKGTYAGIAPTNRSVSWRACNVVEMRGGKAVRSRIYGDNVSLLQQIGAIVFPRATAAG